VSTSAASGARSDPRTSLQHQLAELADRACPTRAAQHQAGGSDDLRSGVGHGDRPADHPQRREIVDIVAEVRRPGRVDAPPGEPVEHGGRLVADGGEHLDPELRRADGDDRIALGRHDQERDAGSE
jgi:hypothetical protein